jgi:hypothetical protein
MVCDLPLKGLLSGITPVVLPALAAEKREGRCLKTAVFNGVAILSVILWPALATIALSSVDVMLKMGDDSISGACHRGRGILLSGFPGLSMLILTGHVKQTVTAPTIASDQRGDRLHYGTGARGSCLIAAHHHRFRTSVLYFIRRSPFPVDGAPAQSRQRHRDGHAIVCLVIIVFNGVGEHWDSPPCHCLCRGYRWLANGESGIHWHALQVIGVWVMLAATCF